MVARRRADGLYDVDGLDFPIPRDYVPAYHLPVEEQLYNQNAQPPPPAPDNRLAQGEGGSASTQQYAQTPSRFESQPTPAPPPADVPRDRNIWGMEGQSAGQSMRQISHDSGQGGASAAEAAQAASSQAVNPKNLEPGPGEKSGSHEAGVERTPMDEAYSTQLLRAARGTPGPRSPGGDQLVGQVWNSQDFAVTPEQRNRVMPSTDIDPETGQPIVIPAQGAEPRFAPGIENVSRQVQAAMAPGYEPGTRPHTITGPDDPYALPGMRQREEVPIEEQRHIAGLKPEQEERPVPVSGSEEFATRQEHRKELEGQLAEQRSAEMLREGARKREQGHVFQAAAEDEKAELLRAKAMRDKQQADYDHLEGMIKQLQNDLPNMAARAKLPSDTQSHFGLAIAQALLVAGGRPYVNLVREAIQDDFQREQAAMNWQMQQAHLKMGAITTLAKMNQEMRDPIAAAHAFNALRWQQAEHEAFAMSLVANGAQMTAEAQQVQKQFEIQKQHELELAIGALRTRQWQTVAPSQGQGIPGGLAGINKYIDSLGLDKKTAAAWKQHTMQQIAEGKQFTMPRGEEGNQNLTRTDERLAEYSMGTAVRLPSWMDSRQPTVHARKPDEGEKARNAIDAGARAEHALDVAQEMVRKAGGKTFPNWRTQLHMALNTYITTVRQADGDGVLKVAELPFLEKQTGAEAIGNLTSLADAQTIIDRSRELTRKAVATRIGESQVTMTPGGKDYWKPGGHPQSGSFIKKYGGTPEGGVEE